jgi:hypothetical protein
MKPRNSGKLCFLCLTVLALLLCGSSHAGTYIVIESFTSFDAGAVAIGYHPANAHYNGQLVGWTVTANGWRIEPDYLSPPPPYTSTVVTVTETGLLNVLGGDRFTSAQWDTYYGDSSSVLSASAGRAAFNKGPGEKGWISFKYDGLTGNQGDLSAESRIRVHFDPDHLSYLRPSIMRVTLADSDSSWYLEQTWPYSAGTNPPAMHADFILSQYAPNGISLEE